MAHGSIVLGLAKLNTQKFVVGQFIARFYAEQHGGNLQASERLAGRAMDCTTTNLFVIRLSPPVAAASNLHSAE